MTKRKIRSQFYLIPMILVFVAVVIVYYGNYNNTINIIKSEYNSKIDLIEQSIQNETKYTEIISKIVERNVQESMEENSNKMIEKYKGNPNVLEWDLEKMRDQFNHMDIYILDQDLKVITSSIEEEIGLNLNAYPDYAKRLKKRLAGDQFESDTINFSILEGELKKYSYMPTPDHQYLFELSVTIKDIYPELEDLNIVYLSRDLKDKYEFVEDIRVYKYNEGQGRSHDLDAKNKQSIKNKELTKDRNIYVKKALETKEVQKHIVKDENDNTYTLKYIPYAVYSEEKKLTWWQSYVVGIQYNNQIMTKEITYQRKLFLRSMLFISVLYFVFAYTIMYLIYKNRQIAYIDYLTGLPNRKKFEETLENKMLEANKKNTKVAILFFDLNKFKEVNDRFGHSMGDQVLQEVAKRIKGEMPKRDIISRLGGDEFAGLISDLSSPHDINEIGKRMSDLFKKKFEIGLNEVGITPSIGISIYPDHGDTLEGLLLKADRAMYEAKHKQVGYKIYEK